MTVYLGDFPDDHTDVVVFFNAFDSNDPSASVIVSDFVVADVAVYKDGGTTQRTSTSGFTLLDTDGINFDGLVGVHGVSIDLSDNTDAGFFAPGAEFDVIIGPITIDVATVTFHAAHFSIERAGGILALIRTLTTKQDSDMVVLNTSHTKTQSDIVVSDDKADSDMVLLLADHDKTQSDVLLGATVIALSALSTKQDSDMVVLNTSHTKTQSDVALADTNIAALSTKQDSDMVILAASHTKTQSDIVVSDDKADSDMVLLVADHDKTQSDIVLLSDKADSDQVLNLADHDKTQSDVLLGATAIALTAVSTKVDSDAVLADADHDKTQSDIVLLSDKADSDQVLNLADHDKTQSDVLLGSTAIALSALSTKQDSDMVVLNTSHTKTQSDVTLADTNIANLSTKQDSDMVVLAASHTKTQSDIVVSDDKADSDMVLLIADHDKTQSDVAVAQAALDIITGTSGVVIENGSIAAASFAAGAIDAAALATDAVNEIRDAIIPTQNAAFTFKFTMVAASDHVTPVTGMTGGAVTRSIDGGAYAAAAGTLSEIANGTYRFAATAADMNGGEIGFRIIGTGGTPGAPDDKFVYVTTTGGV